MSPKNIVFEAGADGIASLTISRPEKLNAIDASTIQEMGLLIDEVDRDPTIRGLLLTGSGEKAFVAGADIGELSTADPLSAAALSAEGQRVFRKFEEISKPSVAAVNGFALGAGLELAMACSIRVASRNARLGLPEVKLGVIPGYGGTQRLPRLVGKGRALELLLTGDMIDAVEAHRIGLVNAVVEQEELLSYARAVLGKIVANGPVALRLTMQAVDVGLNCGFEQGQQFESTAFGLVASTSDRREGTGAFLEKRPAVFTGK